jgi:hypothetical protein
MAALSFAVTPAQDANKRENDAGSPHLKQFAQCGEQIYSSWKMAKKSSNCLMEQIEIHKRHQMYEFSL